MTLSPSQNRITKKLPFLSPIRAPGELWSTPGTFTRPPANTNTTLITRRFEAPAPLVTWVNTLTAAECHDLPHRRWYGHPPRGSRSILQPAPCTTVWPLALLDDLRFKRGGPIPRHIELDRAGGIGQHRRCGCRCVLLPVPMPAASCFS